MFFEDDEDDVFFNNHNPGLYHISHAYLGASPDSIITNPSDLYARVPTHTEDGIPIRKLYVSNLPPNTTRTELFGVFAPYGFIKSCWLRMGDKAGYGPTPTYAFVTFSNPADAHKALKAPCHEKTLRGRNLRISPADSWHQPAQDADGRVRWKPCSSRRAHSESELEPLTEPTTSTEQSTTEGAACLETVIENIEEAAPIDIEPEQIEDETLEEHSYDILDILNQDCLTQVLSYLPITDLIRSERVNKRWQSMVAEYLEGVRTYKTSWWTEAPATLTTAVLRRVLQRVGNSLTRLHIDHHWSTLNDRTAHTIGKFCPNLEELKVVGMHTKNWNPLIYGCKQLKSLAFVSCNKLTDSSLIHTVKNDSIIESLTVANNTHVTGLFLTGSRPPPKLHSLTFYNCYSLQGTVLCAAFDSLPNLTTLKLDVCPVSLWKIIPAILSKVPKLEELSLSEYTSMDALCPQNNAFCESLANLTELKVINFSRNIYITNDVLKQVAQSCPNLESLNISSCNARKTYPGVGDAGVSAVCTGCRRLAHLDASYLAALTDAGLGAAARLPRLHSLTARGNPALSAAPLAAALQACPLLQEVDVCGCDGVSEEVCAGAVRALGAAPRRVLLRLGGTPAAAAGDAPAHRLLAVNTDDDLSNPQLRPDFVDRIFDDSSEESFDDLYSHEDFREFMGADEELFIDEDDFDDYDDYDAVYAIGQDIIIL